MQSMVKKCHIWLIRIKMKCSRQHLSVHFQQLSDFIKIRSVVSETKHADGQPDLPLWAHFVNSVQRKHKLVRVVLHVPVCWMGLWRCCRIVGPGDLRCFSTATRRIHGKITCWACCWDVQNKICILTFNGETSWKSATLEDQRMEIWDKTETRLTETDSEGTKWTGRSGQVQMEAFVMTVKKRSVTLLDGFYAGLTLM
jgi:hypothetical protein